MEENDLEIKRIPYGLLEQDAEKEKGPKIVISPVIELTTQGRDQPIDDPGVFSQGFKTVSLEDQFFYQVKQKCFWHLLTFIVLCGQLYQYGFPFTSLYMYIISIVIATYWYRKCLTSANQMNIENFIHELTDSPECQRALLRQLNSPKSITPDDQCQWLNNVMTKLWPYINGIVQQQMDRKGISSRGIRHENTIVYVEQFSLGDKPPRISHIKINTTGIRVDETVIDFTLYYCGYCLITIGRNPQSNLNLRAGVSDVKFQCNTRMWLRPSLATPPLIGGIAFCLLDQTLINFHCLSLAKIVDNRLVKAAILHVISALMVDPNKFYISTGRLPELRRRLVWPTPIALCYFQIFQARNLPQKQGFHLQRNPHCRIRVGSKYFETKKATDATNPIWNDSRVSPVHDYYDEFKVEIFDSDVFRFDATVGVVSFQISNIINDECVNGSAKWFPVSKTRSGEIYMRVTCFPLLTNFGNRLPSLLPEGIPSGLVHIFIHDIQADVDLGKRTIKPFLLIKDADKVFCTKPVSSGAWVHKLNAECCFASYDIDTDKIELIAIDQQKMSVKKAKTMTDFKKDDYLSAITLNTKQLLKEPNMTFDGVLQMKGETSYVVTIYVQFLISDTNKDIIDNFQKGTIEPATLRISDR